MATKFSSIHIEKEKNGFQVRLSSGAMNEYKEEIYVFQDDRVLDLEEFVYKSIRELKHQNK